MSTSTASEKSVLKVSRFDSVTSLFLALILFLGCFALMLFIIWWLSGDPKADAAPIEITYSGTENPPGFERDFEPPGAEEVEDLMEPTLEDTLEAVTDAVSTVAGAPTSSNTPTAATTKGTGKGDSRRPGPPGEGIDAIPEYERWELTFNAKGRDDYARQLDFYKIELCAFGGGRNGLDIASNLSSSPRKRTTADPTTEKRIYFSWKRTNPLRQFDLQLLGQAGVQTNRRSTVLLIDENMKQSLLRIEKDYCEKAGKKFPESIAKTYFESSASGSGYEWKLIDQRYRPGR